MDKPLDDFLYWLKRLQRESDQQCQENFSLMDDAPGIQEYHLEYWKEVGRRKALTEVLELFKNTFGG